MADAVVSIVLQKLADIMEKQIRDEINLVRGVEEEVLHLSSELTTIRNVLDDAEKRRYKDKSLQHWLKKLEDLSCDVDDVLDEWNYAILKHRIERSTEVCSFVPRPCLSFNKVATRHDIALKIKGLKERLDKIVKEKDRYDFIIGQPVEPQETERVRSTSSIDVSDIYGRVDEKVDLLSKLIPEGVRGDEFSPSIVSIVGAGGIGKTTLAQVVYNDDAVKHYFKLRIWVCVSDVFDGVKICKEIVENVERSSPNLSELEALLKCVRDSVSAQKFLLVLDDVWTEDYTKWEPLRDSLKCGGLGSKILVTTRSERVARMMGTAKIHRLGLLSDMDCWLLMRRIAFSGRIEQHCEELQDIGENIARKCKGLPLAAKVLGCLLRFKDTTEEWTNVLDSELWQLEESEVDLFPHLLLSYKELSPAMQRCFSFCAIFPKDSEIDVDKLISMWMALGYLGSSGNASDLELRGKEYFDKLRMRSFFQDFVQNEDEVSCKMHDIVHDFAQFLRKTTSHDLEDLDGRVEGRKKELSKAYNSLLFSQIMGYRTLICEDELPTHLSGCKERLRVLSFCESQWQQIMRYLKNLIHLTYLELRGLGINQGCQIICKLYNLQTLYLSDCDLKEIPREIGNLVHLRRLFLDRNSKIEELPESICNLQELRTLNLSHCSLSTLPRNIYNLQELRTLDISWCRSLCKLPEGIERLRKLRHLRNEGSVLDEIPQGLEQLTGLETLNIFCDGGGRSKLGCLNKLNLLSGSLELDISLRDADDVVEARKAELSNKKHIQRLDIKLYGPRGERDEDELVRFEAIEALQPPPNLQRLRIGYSGTKFPGWITSSLNHLRVLEFVHCRCQTLPPLGKLPCLEELFVWGVHGMLKLSSEFLGIPAGDINHGEDDVISFPKLKRLMFCACEKWKEWEDITDEEAGNANLSIMPCLIELKIVACDSLMAPSYKLLCKASTLKYLTVVHLKNIPDVSEIRPGWRSLPPYISHVELTSGWHDVVLRHVKPFWKSINSHVI